ncbi:MAG: hypothetical protein HKN33_03915 [Pyrinomonadaceae bacterium]|nr:hypothetical protein [Pyrinomonadaceae bacterium]
MNSKQDRSCRAEKGGAGAKMLICAVVLILIANAGYNFIPVAYQGENFKQEIHTAVVQGVSLPSTYGKPAAIIRHKIQTAARANDVPYDAVIDVKEKNNLVTARVYYAKKVPLLPFGAFEYSYVFDHTATPNGYLTRE